MFPLKMIMTKTTGYFKPFNLITVFYDLFLSCKVLCLVSNFRVHWMLMVRYTLQQGTMSYCIQMFYLTCNKLLPKHFWLIVLQALGYDFYLPVLSLQQYWVVVNRDDLDNKIFNMVCHLHSLTSNYILFTRSSALSHSRFWWKQQLDFLL
jgi:hypothetical protein